MDVIRIFLSGRACSVCGCSPCRYRGSARYAAEIQQAVNAAYEKFRTLKDGKNADYIPALAKVDPDCSASR